MPGVHKALAVGRAKNRAPLKRSVMIANICWLNRLGSRICHPTRWIHHQIPWISRA